MSSKVDYVFALAYQLSLWTLRSQHHSDVFAIEDNSYCMHHMFLPRTAQIQAPGLLELWILYGHV
jgi:hypothetical protein